MCKDVVVMGGGDVVRQCVDDGLADELVIDLAPIILGAGTPLFVMQITMSVPLQVNVNVLRRDLEALSGELNCDVDLEAG